MNGERITPVVLTWNEAANIERTLGRLDWARRVLVLDSGSSDGTAELARQFANVIVAERKFDSHAAQWEAAIRHPAVETDWVLALDADYLLTPELVREIEQLEVPAEIAALRSRFRYCIEGTPLRASLYPPVTVLFDRRRARYVQDGHTQRLVVDGPVGNLVGRIHHDDRKSFDRFLVSQQRYADLEAPKLRATRWMDLNWSGRLRRLRWVSPFLVPTWLLAVKGLALEGAEGWAYARQRWAAEWAISRALGAHDRQSKSMLRGVGGDR